MNRLHSPGPWSIAAMKTQSGLAPVVFGCNGRAVAMKHPDDGQLRWDANARLIAAAPELLAALESIIQSAGYERGECEPALLNRGLTASVASLDAARAAVAKAKGGAA